MWSWSWLAMEPFPKLLPHLGRVCFHKQPHQWAHLDWPRSAVILCHRIHSCLMTDRGQTMSKGCRNNNSHGLAASEEMKERGNKSLNLGSINNIYMELGKASNWRTSVIISELIKYNLDTYRDECINRKWEKGVMVKNQIQQIKDSQAHTVLLFELSMWNNSLLQPISGSFFHPIKSTAWATTQILKRRESDYL